MIRAPQRWTHLPADLQARALAIHQTIATVHPITREQWLEGFLHDMHPDAEIALWEGLAAKLRRELNMKRRIKMFHAFLSNTPVIVTSVSEQN